MEFVEFCEKILGVELNLHKYQIEFLNNYKPINFGYLRKGRSKSYYNNLIINCNTTGEAKELFNELKKETRNIYK